MREVLALESDVVEQHMFGGLTFMVGGHMCCGVVNQDLMVRVGAQAFERLARKPAVRPMDFTRRPLKGFVYVGPEGWNKPAQLKAWIGRALTFVRSLPSKS